MQAFFFSLGSLLTFVHDSVFRYGLVTALLCQPALFLFCGGGGVRESAFSLCVQYNSCFLPVLPVPMTYSNNKRLGTAQRGFCFAPLLVTFLNFFFFLFVGGVFCWKNYLSDLRPSRRREGRVAQLGNEERCLLVVQSGCEQLVGDDLACVCVF